MKLENSGLERPGISLWTKFYTREAFLNLISGIWLRTRRTMCYRKFMKGPVEIIRELDQSFTRSSMQGIIGQLSKQMRKLMSKYMTNANDLVMSPDNHQKYLTPMMVLWPFAQWGLDILGSFPLGTRQMKFLVMGIDYFTKWVEAEPLTSIT